MKQIRIRITPAVSAGELASVVRDLLAPELGAARGGFGGGLSYENFTQNVAPPPTTPDPTSPR